MDFERPLALLLLLLVFGLLFHPARNALAVPSLSHLRGGGSIRTLLAWVPGALQQLGLFLVVASLSGPRLTHPTTTWSAGQDIVVALDVSRSMADTELTEPGRAPVTRWQLTQRSLDAFIEARPNDRIGLVVFDQVATTQVPPTLDHTTLRSVLRTLEPSTQRHSGTAVGDGIALAAKRLHGLDAPGKTLLVFTDGLHNAGDFDPVVAATVAQAVGIEVHTVLVGRGYATVLRAVTQMEAVAEAGGGTALRARTAESFAPVFSRLDELTPTPAIATVHTRHTALFRWFLAPGAALLGLSLMLGRTVLRIGP